MLTFNGLFIVKHINVINILSELWQKLDFYHIYFALSISQIEKYVVRGDSWK